MQDFEMAFFSSALIFDGAAGFCAQAVPVPIASETSIAAKTVDFTIMFLPHLLLPIGLETHHRIGNRKEQWVSLYSIHPTDCAHHYAMRESQNNAVGLEMVERIPYDARTS